MTQLPFDYSNIPRDSRRVPLATKVSFKYDRFSGFISEFSANISPTGMYITTKTPEPPGSMLDFEFRLGDGFEIIQGKGEVVWTRAIAEGPSRPPGMGIRFLDLSEGSKELIYRIVDQYIQDGGTPFDVSLRPPDPVPLSFPETAPVPAAAAAASPFPDLPDSGVLPPVDSSSWLPPLPPLPETTGFSPSPVDDDFPSFMPPMPPMDEPEPVRPTLAFGGMSVPEQKSRILPLALAGLVLALAAAGYLFRDSLMGMVGMGGDDTAVAAAVPEPVRRQAPPPAPQEGTVIEEEDGSTPSDTPMPEVVRRKEAEEALAAPPAVALSGPAMTALEKITFEQAFGGTDIVLQGNGVIRPETYAEEGLMGNPPRKLIRFLGMSRGYPATKVAVGTDEVKQVRTGFHEKPGGNELHVVIDLASAGVKVTRVEAKDNQLRIHLQRQ